MNVQTWFTAQECAGMPGFPSGVSNVRKQLENSQRGWTECGGNEEGLKPRNTIYRYCLHGPKIILGIATKDSHLWELRISRQKVA